jgi:hypothetical protein
MNQFQGISYFREEGKKKINQKVLSKNKFLEIYISRQN